MKKIPTLYKTFQHWSENGSVYILSDLHFADSDCKLMAPDWIEPEEQIYNLSNLEAGIKRYDVGVDANGYYPVSINQIEKFFKGIMQEEGTL